MRSPSRIRPRGQQTTLSWGDELRELVLRWKGDVVELPQAFAERDPAARSAWEVLTLYPGVKAIIGHRLAHTLWRQNHSYAARAVSECVRFLTGVEIHPGACIGQRVVIDHGTGVVIGETAVVGDDVTLYQGVTLGGTRHVRGKRHPTIGSGVVIGVGASVLGDVRVDDGARIGAGAVVVSDVAAGTTVGGIPASVLRKKAHGAASGSG